AVLRERRADAGGGGDRRGVGGDGRIKEEDLVPVVVDRRGQVQVAVPVRVAKADAVIGGGRVQQVDGGEDAAAVVAQLVDRRAAARDHEVGVAVPVHVAPGDAAGVA